MDHQRQVEKMLLLNIGLDIAYLAGGLAMYQYGNGTKINYPELWKGFGTSIMVRLYLASGPGPGFILFTAYQ